MKDSYFGKLHPSLTLQAGSETTSFPGRDHRLGEKHKTRRTFSRPPGLLVFPPTRKSSAFFVLGDPVDALLDLLGRIVGKAVLHEEGVFAAVLIEGAQDAHRPELLSPEE